MNDHHHDHIIFDSLQLRGERKYIQGSEIFSHLLAYLNSAYGEVDDLDISFRSMVQRSLQLFISDDIPSNANVKFSFKTPTRQATGYLVETGPIITDRIACQEASILQKASLDGAKRYASISNAGEFPIVSCYVALIKKLVLSTTDFPNLWLGRAHLHGPVLKASSGTQEVQVGTPSNLRILRSELLFDGQKAGEIFSLVKVGV